MTPALAFRKATTADGPVLFLWRNDPGTLASLRGRRAVPLREHCLWLARAVADPNVALYMAVLGDTAVGTGRLQLEADRLLCSITVSPEHRGRGYAVQVIRFLRDHAALDFGDYIDRALEAEVLTSNIASQHAFSSAGFVRVRFSGAGDDAIVVMRCQR